MQISVGLARLRALDQHGHRLPADELQDLRAFAADELRTCSLSRYWHGDYATALSGFRILRRYGFNDIPRRRWARAWVGRVAGQPAAAQPVG